MSKKDAKTGRESLTRQCSTQDATRDKKTRTGIWVRRDSLTGKFLPETGRVIKSSPTKPRLGLGRIQNAVNSYVHRDDAAKKDK